jgi:hypothetical protein
MSMPQSQLHRLARLVAATAAVVMAAVAFAGPVAAATPQMLFVSATTGSDSNACTAAMPCKTIGYALTSASPGSTVRVGAGTYAEQVSITSRVNLVGSHAVIDANGLNGGIQPLAGMGIVGYGVLVFGPGAAGTRVSGFTVENATGEGILVAATSHVTIAQNLLQHNDRGVGTALTLECQDQGPIPGDCGEGLHLMGVTWSHVTGNVVQHNVGGILVTDEVGPSAHNTISWNTSRWNLEDCGITLPSHNGAATTNPALGGVYNNLVTHNVSLGNGGAGVGMFAPFPGTASYNNTVSYNTLVGNGEAGVAIHAHAPGQYVSGNVIVHNRVSGNGIDPDSGSGATTGIALFSAVVPVSVTVAMNTVANEHWGIFIAGNFNVAGLGTNVFTGTVTSPTN